MRLSLLLVAVSFAGTGALAAQSASAPKSIAPLTRAELAQAFARAVPYGAFRAADTAYNATWAAADARAIASVAIALQEAPPPAGPWRLLVVAEHSCTDALAALPYIARLVDQMPGSELRVLRRADGLPLIETHLLDGHTATPLVLVLDADFVEHGVWLERASHIQAFVTQNTGKMSEEQLWARVRVMRRDDDGRTPLREMMALMRRP